MMENDLYNCVSQAGEMDQGLRALTAFLEDLGSVLSIHMTAHNSLQLQDLTSSHGHTCRENTHHIK